MPRRKTTSIHLDEIRRLAKLQCTKQEAADSLGITIRTFNRLLNEDQRVADAWRSGQSGGKISLRRKQHRLAGSNAAMAIWLGRQHLGQQEVVKTELTGADGGPVETATTDYSNLNPKERKELRDLLAKAEAATNGRRAREV